MGDKPTIKGLLGGLLGLLAPSKVKGFGLGKPPVTMPNTPKPDLPESGSQESGAPRVSEAHRGVTERSEAYHNRKKGRKLHKQSIVNQEGILTAIERLGEATPAQLSQELGIPRSTLTYFLKRFIDHYHRSYHEPGYYYAWKNRLLRLHLDGKRLVRLGKGPSVRYRFVPDEGPEQPGETPKVG